MADKKKSATPANETSQQKLTRLASKRVPKAVKAIAGIANLKTYKPTPAQAKAIVNALATALAHCEQRLTSAEAKNESQFQLPAAG